MTTKPKLLIVDGMALLFRSFFASAAMGHFIRLKDGTPTNGAQGFVRHVLTAQSIMQPTHLAVCWDMGAHTFRNELFDGYKANRPAPPEEMLPQFDMAKNLSEQIGWQNFGVQGMEADDVIGSMITKWQDEADITVISGDKDLLQLLNPSTQIAFMKKGYTEYDIYTHTRFLEEYGIEPMQFAQVKAFMGDASDGYPGVKGIGPKQALTLIQTYGSIENVLASIEELKPGQRTKIQDSLDMLRLSHELATIQSNVPIEADFTNLALQNYKHQTFSTLEEQGFTLITKQARSLYSLI